MVAGQPTTGSVFSLFSLASSDHQAGAATGYSSSGGTIGTAGLFTTMNGTAQVGTDVLPTGYRTTSCTGDGTNTLADITWENVERIAFTYSHDNAAGTTINLSLLNLDGTTSNYKDDGFRSQMGSWFW